MRVTRTLRLSSRPSLELGRVLWRPLCVPAGSGLEGEEGEGLDRNAETAGAMKSYMSSGRRGSSSSLPWVKKFKQKEIGDDADAYRDVDDSDIEAHGNNKRPRGRRGREKDIENKESQSESPHGTGGIPPAVHSMLDDWSHFEDIGRKGLTVDTSEMDDLDAFMSLIYAEAAKTSDGKVWGTYEEGVNRRGRGGKRNNTRIPHPRTTRQLARTTVPQICPNIGGVPGTEGYALASEAWKVLAKNPYYTLKEKKDMCNRIARKTNWYLDDSQGLYDEELADSEQPHANKNKWSVQDIEAEMIWKENFSKGLKGIQEEEALAQKLEEEEFQNRQKKYAGQDDTNWDVEAVVDEDDLFK